MLHSPLVCLNCMNKSNLSQYFCHNVLCPCFRIWYSSQPNQWTANERQWYESHLVIQVMHTLWHKHINKKKHKKTTLLNSNVPYVAGYGAQAGGYGGQATKGNGIVDVMIKWSRFEHEFDTDLICWHIIFLFMLGYGAGSNVPNGNGAKTNGNVRINNTCLDE